MTNRKQKRPLWLDPWKSRGLRELSLILIMGIVMVARFVAVVLGSFELGYALILFAGLVAIVLFFTVRKFD